MKFFDLVNISEQTMSLVNPSSPEKILRVGRAMGFLEGQQVIDFGCGFGEPLALWAEHYGIRGIGIDIREAACDRARARLAAFGDRFQIVCADAARYTVENAAFDAAVCLGATFIWNGYRETIRAMREAVKPGGRLLIGEAYWLTRDVPPAFAKSQNLVHEADLLSFTREEGYDLLTIARASQDEWDRYESDNWVGLLKWLDENPEHPERQEVLDHLCSSQDEHFQFMKPYVGWAMFALTPAA